MIDVFELARKYDIVIKVEYEERYNHYVVTMNYGVCYRREIINESDYASSKANGDNAMSVYIMNCIVNLLCEAAEHRRNIEEMKTRWEKKKLLKKMKVSENDGKRTDC